jgi:hypothetical protein
MKAILAILALLVLAAMLDKTAPAKLLVELVLAADRFGYALAVLALAAAVAVVRRGVAPRVVTS